jgi:hypothetical protein
MIKLKNILKELRLVESGIRDINRLAKENDKADLYFHMDLDGVTSAIAMKAYLERYGIKVVNTEHIQYGGREYSAPRPTPGHMVVLVDFAHGKPMVTIHTDHHDTQSGVEAGTSAKFKKKPSNVETISQEISPTEIFPSEDIKIISTVDSADFARQGLDVDDVLQTAFKLDRSGGVLKNRTAMGLVANKVILAFKNQPRYLENIVMEAKPSLISIYTIAMKNARAAGLKPEDLDIPQAFYVRSQRPEVKKKDLTNVSNVERLMNGEYGMVGNVLVQYGMGALKGGGYDRYVPFKNVPEAEYLVLGYPMGLVQASKNPFKTGENPYDLGQIGKKIINKYKSYLQSKVLTFREIKKMMESEIDYKGTGDTTSMGDNSFGFTMKDLIALFGDVATNLPKEEKKELIDAISDKLYKNLTDDEKKQLEDITVSAYDIIVKSSGGHRNITNISGINFLKGDSVEFVKRVMVDLAKELKNAKLQ